MFYLCLTELIIQIEENPLRIPVIYNVDFPHTVAHFVVVIQNTVLHNTFTLHFHFRHIPPSHPLLRWSGVRIWSCLQV